MSLKGKNAMQKYLVCDQTVAPAVRHLFQWVCWASGSTQNQFNNTWNLGILSGHSRHSNTPHFLQTKWYYWEFGWHGLRIVSISIDYVFWSPSVPSGSEPQKSELELGYSCGLNASYRIILSAELRIKKVLVSKSFPSGRINNVVMPVGLDRWRLDTRHQAEISGLTWSLVARAATDGTLIGSLWSNGQVSPCHLSTLKRGSTS